MWNVFFSDIDRPVIETSNANPKEGDDISISCHANSNPAIFPHDWYWKHNGNLILHFAGPNLTLTKVSKSKHEGIYECIGHNEVRRVYNSTKVQILCKRLTHLGSMFLSIPSENIRKCIISWGHRKGTLVWNRWKFLCTTYDMWNSKAVVRRCSSK